MHGLKPHRGLPLWLCFSLMPNTQSLLWVSHSSCVLISSSFPCNRSFGDRKNSCFLFRLNCLLCLISSSMVISIFIGLDNIHIWKLSVQQRLTSIYQVRPGFRDLPSKKTAPTFQLSRRHSRVVMDCEYLGIKDISVPTMEVKRQICHRPCLWCICRCDKQKEKMRVSRLSFRATRI